jgi:ABC-type dipeptide/oligopeptide/nickel transport system ATPase component
MKWSEVEAELKARQAAIPIGCVYDTRCPLADKDGRCARDRPTLLEVEEDHSVACFHLMEEWADPNRLRA